MKVPFLDLTAQLGEVGEELKKAVTEVIDSGQYVLGPPCERFEREVARYAGVAHAVGVSSGTDALLVALMAHDVGPGDVVVTSAYSFFATAGAIARLGATPTFVDIDPETYNIDGAALESWLARPGSTRVKAIVPVHLFGQCADMDVVLDVAARRGVPVIEDAAQALGARWGARFAGSMGTAGCLSFFPSKNLGGLGDAGMVLTDDEALAAKIRMLRAHGAKRKHHHVLLGGNFRLDAIQAAALLAKLPHLERWNSARRARAAYYDEHITSPAIRKPVARSGHVYNQYVISVDRRDELQAFLTEREIGHEVYYPRPLPLQECFRELGHRVGEFPASEHAAAHAIALPLYPQLTTAMQDLVIEALEAFHA